jgi:GT2 family glycosyltransferase
MRRRIQTAKVLCVDLEEPLEPVAVEARYGEVVLVVRSRGRVVGQVSLPALEVLSVETQRTAIWQRLGEVLWRQELEDRFRRAVGADWGAVRPPSVSVSVVVCTRDRPADLERCLASLAALDPPAHEIVVVDNSPASEAARDVCGRYPVRYVHEPVPGQARARNRGIACSTGDVVAFTDDDCVVDRGWLSGIAGELADQRAMVVTGVVCPIELETPAQYLFEEHGGFRRGYRRRVLDGLRVVPSTAAGLAGAGASMAVRRRVFDEVGPFSEWLGPGTPARAADDNDLFCRVLAAGYTIVYDPGQLVWHRHRDDLDGLRRVFFDYAASSSAFATARIVDEHDLAALRIFAWWWLRHIPRELARVLLRRRARMPLRCVLAEVRGALAGPWRLWRSRRSRRSIEPIALPAPSPPADDRLVVLGADAPSLSVVVPSAGRRPLLEQVLVGLARQRYPADRFEAVVVLDGTSDDSAELLRSIEVPFQVRVLELSKAGVAAARNAGVRAAEQPVIHFLDDDIVPEPGCLAAHAAAHRRNPIEHVALGYCPPVVDGGWWGQALRGWWEDHYRRKGEPGHRWTNVDFTTGNSSLRRDALLAAGGFDEAFRVRHEDWELGGRLLRQGVSFGYYPATIAWHHLDTSFATALEHQRREARDDVLLARRHPELGLQLPLAAYRRGRPQVDLVRLGRGAARTARLERHGRRAAWRRDTARLLGDAYVAGLRDEVPSEEEFQALLGAVFAQAPATVEVRLDGAASPPVPVLGQVELALFVGDTVVARVRASDPGAPLDWASASDRVVREGSAAIRAAILSERLGRTGGTAPRALELVDAR